MKIHQRLASVFVGFLLAVLAAAAGAQSLPAGDPNAPVRIDADSLEVRRKDGVAVFSGNVEATQGGVSIRGDEMEVYYSEAGKKGGAAAGVVRVEVKGKVTVSSGKETASGDRAVYDVPAKTVVMEGKELILKSGSHSLRGSRLVYDVETGLSRMEGVPSSEGGGKGRVSGTFVPEGAEAPAR
jgi:lipopolysaccharide export system protein LptA